MKSPKKRQLNELTLLNGWWRRGRVELPVQEKLPRIYYKLSQLFNLAGLTSADRVKARPVDISFTTLINVGVAAPQFNGARSQPIEDRLGERTTYV
jgi:hypothetical protein